MNKTVKSVLFGIGAAAVIGLIVFFGYLGFKGEKTLDRMTLSYTDEVTMKDGELEAVKSGVEFKNEDATKCRMNVKWGNGDDNVSFITMIKIIAPSGKVESWVTGDWGDCEMEFDLSEKGTYKICNEYFTTAEEFDAACKALDPDVVTEKDTFDYSGNDGKWNMKVDISIVTSK